MTDQPDAYDPADLAERYGLAPGATEVLAGAEALGRPIVLVNHFALRAEAQYEPGVGDSPCSGVDAMVRYAAVSGDRLAAVGGRFLHQGFAAGALWGDDQRWDLVVVAEYPSVAAFRALLADPAYREAYRHRAAAVERQRTTLSIGFD